jgi:DNA-binding transcriptional ArsR family regulator
VRELGGWISRLIELMAQVGVEPQAVRSAISRLEKRGILLSERRDGVAGYALSEYAESVLAEGDRRMFKREEPQEADWVLAVFSVPEAERDKRHTLRSRPSCLDDHGQHEHLVAKVRERTMSVTVRRTCANPSTEMLMPHLDRAPTSGSRGLARRLPSGSA